MSKKKTYCDVNFLVKFADKLSTQTTPMDEGQLTLYSCWVNLFKFMQTHADLYINDKTKFNELASDNNKLCIRLKKLWAGGQLTIFPYTQIDFSALSDEDLNAIFLLDDEPFILSKAERNGILIITPSTFGLHECLYKNNGVPIRINDSIVTDWSFLRRKAKHNYNAMIISDLYICKEKQLNLLTILDSLLPQELDVPFQLSIYTDTPTIDVEYQNLLQECKRMRPKLNIEFTLIKGSSADFHDRGILTNYIRIKCGTGFDLFTKDRTGSSRARRTTDVDIDYPYFNIGDVSTGSYENILEDAKRMSRNNLQYGFKINRLL